MKLLVVADGHYYIDEQQKVYVESVFDYAFYARYLSVFDSVYAIVRAEKVKTAPANCKLASGPHVHFLPIPPSRGLKQFAQNYFTTRRLIKQYVKECDCAIFRVPGVVANTALPIFARTKKPYALEVVVDPWEYFAKGTVRGITRPIVRYVWTQNLKKVCKEALGVSYVTESYLQQKYPCQAVLSDKAPYFTGSYSSVELPDDQFAAPKVYTAKDKFIISHVANAFTGYGKGHVVLMQAVQKVLAAGYKVDVWFMGDGKLRPVFEQIAADLGIKEHIFFLGRMASGAEVRQKVRHSDLFVFPTRAEGLPRVILEAMAEGIPAIASPVCGIPEILPAECLVNYDDVQGYTDAIIRLITHPDLMTAQSKRNIEVSKQYKSSILNQRRKTFYTQLKTLTEKYEKTENN